MSPTRFACELVSILVLVTQHNLSPSTGRITNRCSLISKRVTSNSIRSLHSFPRPLHDLKAEYSSLGHTNCGQGLCYSGRAPGILLNESPTFTRLTVAFRRRGIEARMKLVKPVGAWFSQVGRLHQVHHLWQYSYAFLAVHILWTN